MNYDTINGYVILLMKRFGHNEPNTRKALLELYYIMDEVTEQEAESEYKKFIGK